MIDFRTERAFADDSAQRKLRLAFGTPLAVGGGSWAADTWRQAPTLKEDDVPGNQRGDARARHRERRWQLDAGSICVTRPL
jgi:hypothetical protein